MRNPLSSAITGLATFLALVIVVTPALHADEVPECARLLTQIELEAAAGEKFDEVSDPVVYAEGHTLCTFFAAGGTKSVMVTFQNLKAIQEGMISAETVAAFFDMNVRSTEDVGGSKGQAMKGIGVRAVLFTESERLRMFVETKKGFVEVAATGLTAKQLEAVASAVAAP